MKRTIDYKELIGENNPIKRFPLLLEAALDEFSQKKFNEASLNDILKQAGMSKGSFYHHFGDKFGLYICVSDILVVKKLAYFTPRLKDADINDFFGFLKQLMRATVEYMLEDKRMQEFANRYLEEPEVLKNKVLTLFPYDFDSGFGPVVAAAMEAGTLSNRFSPQFVTKLFELFMSNSYKLISESQTRNTKTVFELVNQLIDFMQYGIAAKERE